MFTKIIIIFQKIFPQWTNASICNMCTALYVSTIPNTRSLTWLHYNNDAARVINSLHARARRRVYFAHPNTATAPTSLLHLHITGPRWARPIILHVSVLWNWSRAQKGPEREASIVSSSPYISGARVERLATALFGRETGTECEKNFDTSIFRTSGRNCWRREENSLERRARGEWAFVSSK